MFQKLEKKTEGRRPKTEVRRVRSTWQHEPVNGPTRIKTRPLFRETQREQKISRRLKLRVTQINSEAPPSLLGEGG
jgi:hypothetical protein